jgi:hypothetical protein
MFQDWICDTCGLGGGISAEVDKDSYKLRRLRSLVGGGDSSIGCDPWWWGKRLMLTDLFLKFPSTFPSTLCRILEYRA